MTQQPSGAKPREWAPRIWEGCDYPAWMRLLVRNRFAVQPAYWYIAAIVSGVSFGHSVLRLVERVRYGRQIDRTPIRQSPIFILGHWRSGTTLLHELLILDDRHAFPNTYWCLEPNHPLLTEELIKRWLWFLMPSRRPMDNMAAGWDRPQEDEFALCMMGQPSPYLTVAFPNRPPQFAEYLDFAGVGRRARDSWKRDFLGLLRKLTFKDPRRLVLKSPTHTARVGLLRELFPEAKFVHIVRDPYVLFPSTVNLWKSLYRTHGLQKPTFAGLEEHVLDTLVRMYAAFERDRPRIPPGHFHEVRYEELVRDPAGEMAKLYDRLGLGGWESVRPKVEEYAARHAKYETNRYELTPEQRDAVTRRWGDYLRRYGYAAGGHFAAGAASRLL
jgi:omega-hydroxy-beta-dihydromenaquinone-9 sulfotransferase